MADENFKHIVRIANVDVPGEKHIRVALKKIKGVSFNFAHIACNLANVDIRKKAGVLTDAEINALTDIINNPQKASMPNWLYNHRKDNETGEDQHYTGGKLGFVKENDIKTMKKIKALRGLRHQKGLPVRGQRTKSNFRRSKGKAIGVKKKGAK
jgi:small subunit ribosomal protein S13